MKYNKDIEKALSLCVNKVPATRIALCFAEVVVVSRDTVAITACDGKIILHLAQVEYDSFKDYYTSQGFPVPDKNEFLLNINQKMKTTHPLTFYPSSDDLQYPNWKSRIPDEFSCELKEYPRFEADITCLAKKVLTMITDRESYFGPDAWNKKRHVAVNFISGMLGGWSEGFLGTMPISYFYLDGFPISGPFKKT